MVKHKNGKVLMIGTGCCLFLVVAFAVWSFWKRQTTRQEIEERELMQDSTNGIANFGVENKKDRGNAPSGMTRTLRFLELLKDFFPADQQEGLKKTIAEGVEKQPDRFGKLAIQYMELYGYLKKAGKLGAYYDALKKERLRNPKDMNVLRILAAVASIPSMNLRNEYETWLAELAKVDSHEDVLFPYAEMLLTKGDAKRAYEQICRTVSEHPSEGPEMLTNSLRIFTENKAADECVQIVGQLKAIDDLDPFHANCCGETLFKDGKLDDAAYFYRKCSTETDSTFFRELADVKLGTIEARQNKASAQTVARLKDLAANSRTPVVRKDARRALISLNIDPPNQPSNSNHPNN